MASPPLPSCAFTIPPSVLALSSDNKHGKVSSLTHFIETSPLPLTSIYCPHLISLFPWILLAKCSMSISLFLNTLRMIHSSNCCFLYLKSSTSRKYLNTLSHLLTYELNDYSLILMEFDLLPVSAITEHSPPSSSIP